MQFTARRLAAAILGVSAWAGNLTAGDVPQQLPSVVSPAPMYAAPQLPPEAVASSGGVVLISGGGGCVGGCASAATPAAAACDAPKAKHPWAIGAGCASPVGCGSCAAEKTFVFGSCRQFFTPGYNCAGGLCGHGRSLEPIIYGPGGYTEPRCSYGSYNNR